MPVSSLALVFAVLAASPGEAVQTVQDSQVRSVWLPPQGSAIEVFVGRAPNYVPIELPEAIKELKADPALATILVDEKARFFWLGVRETAPPRSGLTVALVLADDTELVLRAVMRPSMKDAALRILKRPQVDPEEAAWRARERLTNCRAGEEMIVNKAKLIADRGSEAVINRVLGDSGSLFKQTNGLSLTFVEVVHDAGVSYATLLIKNQSRNDWPVDLEQIKLSAIGVPGNQINIIARASQGDVILASKESRVVLAYETPATPEIIASIGKAGLFVVMAP